MRSREHLYNGEVIFRLIISLLLAFAAISGLVANNREVRYLTFTGKDKNGVIFRDLSRDEVELRIDGDPVEIRFFGRDDVDKAVMFLIENGPRTARYTVSMPHLGQVNTVDLVRYHLVDGILQAAASHGSVLLAQFYREMEILQDFTSDDYLLEDVVNRMKPNVGFLDVENIPISRFLGRGIELLKGRSEKRKAIVLFTATVDRESLQNLDEFRDYFRRQDVDLYVVSFATRNPGAFASHTERTNKLFFDRLVSDTGGRLYISGDYTFLDEFMKDLMSRLQNSYTLGFYVTPGEEPSDHEIEIKVKRPKGELDHKRVLFF